MSPNRQAGASAHAPALSLVSVPGYMASFPVYPPSDECCFPACAVARSNRGPCVKSGCSASSYTRLGNLNPMSLRGVS